MPYQGDITVGQVLRFSFTTRAFATAVPTTLAGTPSMEVYQDDNTTPITTGVTLNVDFSGVAGLNLVEIDTASGYAAQADYSVVIAAGTVGGTSVVGETVGSFSIANRSALRPTTAARTLDVTAAGNAGIDWANVENPTTALNLSGTNIDVDQVVASVSGAVASVTARVTANTDQLAGQTVTAAAGVTFPTAVASPTNITAGTITTVTNLTNAATAGDFTAVMKTSIGTAVAASAVASVTGNVGGNVNGNVVGSVGSVAGNVGGNVNGNLVGDVQGNVDGSVDSVVDPVDANITAINGTTVIGDGGATPWGP